MIKEKTMLVGTSFFDNTVLGEPVSDGKLKRHWYLTAEDVNDIARVEFTFRDFGEAGSHAPVLQINTETCRGHVSFYCEIPAEILNGSQDITYSLEARCLQSGNNLLHARIVNSQAQLVAFDVESLGNGVALDDEWSEHVYQQRLDVTTPNPVSFMTLVVAPGIHNLYISKCSLVEDGETSLMPLAPTARDAADFSAAGAAPETPRHQAETLSETVASATTDAAVSGETAREPRVGVIGWSMGHNPAGRSYLIADLLSGRYNVELAGPLFPRHGARLWQPLENLNKFPIHTFAVTSFRDFIEKSLEFVKTHPYDVVYICKPRFPSLYIGMLYKLIWNAAVVLDIDDSELSFFNQDTGYSFDELTTHLRPLDWEWPYSEKWTRYALDMLDIADTVTVSNKTLQERFGGTIVRHARDEAVFNPALYDREKTRTELGFAPTDKIVLFLGTPRLHKGINRVAAALDAISDPDVVLCVIGTAARNDISPPLSSYKNARIATFDNQPFERLAELVNIGDVVCILQDEDSLVSKYQIPAKLTDAISMGVPILASPVAPMQDLIEQGVAVEITRDNIESVLREVLSDLPSLAPKAALGRQVFSEGFSYAANAPVAQAAVREAIATKHVVPPAYGRLFDLLQRGAPKGMSDQDAADLLDALENPQLIQSPATGAAPAARNAETPVAASEVAPDIAKEPEPQFRTIPASQPTPHKPGVATVGVIGWDLGHNPVGRSYLVAELLSKAYNVELLGPLFPQYGTELWKPLQGATKLPIHTFRCQDMAEFVSKSIAFVKSHPYDVVHACKPRFSAMFLALLYKLIWNSAVIVDVDDYELSFFNTDKGYSLAELIPLLTEEDWKQPYLEKWTKYANNMMDIADSVTVSNPTLMRLFGGIIVRHARDETVFDPKLYDRDKVRAEFGFKPSDRVILFIGTPRLHKGIIEVAEALDKINDPDAVLCIIGTINDKRVRAAFEAYKKARVVFFDDQPFQRLAELTTMADLSCILQAPDHAIAQHQIPAKLTDAISMGVPVLTTRVPPLSDLIASGAVIGVAPDELASKLKELLASPQALARQGAMGRRFFASDFSYQVNVPRLKLAVDQAVAEKQAVSRDYRTLLKLMQQKLKTAFEPDDFRTLLKAIPASRQWGAINFAEKVNVAYFWKQNDSGVYGRRQDMLVKYLLNSGRVNTIVHFDAPIGISNLMGNVVTDDTAKFQQGNFVVRNTMERFLKMRDEPGLMRRTFIYDDRDGATFMGRKLPKLSGFPDFVAASLEEAGVKDNLMAVVCPVQFDFRNVMEKLEFPFIMADVIDNHLAWQVKPAYEARLRANYEYILGQSDAVFSNCEPVQAAMLEFNSGVQIVPNGAEMFPEGHVFPKPDYYKRLKGPVVGYVGNLRDRVRFDLIATMAEQNPDWNIVLIGSAHGNQTALTLRKYPNINLLGVVPYEEALNHIASFDVAMIPHELGTLTESMNPLKLYVYSAVGVPVVSTPVPNLDDLRDTIYVAESDEDFIACIRQAIADKAAGKARSVGRDAMREFSWEKRVEDIFKVLEAAAQS